MNLLVPPVPLRRLRRSGPVRRHDEKPLPAEAGRGSRGVARDGRLFVELPVIPVERHRYGRFGVRHTPYTVPAAVTMAATTVSISSRPRALSASTATRTVARVPTAATVALATGARRWINAERARPSLPRLICIGLRSVLEEPTPRHVRGGFGSVRPADPVDQSNHRHAT